MKEIASVEYIAKCISDAGFDPGEQLYGYFLTGNPRYITREGNARELIAGVDRRIIETYVLSWQHNRKNRTQCFYKATSKNQEP